MTRDESIVQRVWVAGDGRHIPITETTDQHLQSIFGYVDRHLQWAVEEEDAIEDRREQSLSVWTTAVKNTAYWRSWKKICLDEMTSRRLSV